MDTTGLIRIFIAVFSSCSGIAKFDPVDYVNFLIGLVHGRWFFYTPAARPFGMAKPAPLQVLTESWLAGFPAVMATDISILILQQVIFTTQNNKKHDLCQ